MDDEGDAVVSPCPWDACGCLLTWGQNARGSRPAALSLQQFLPFFTPFSIHRYCTCTTTCLFVCFFTSSVQLTFISLTLRTPAPAPATACAEALSNAPEVAAECCENRGTAGTILPTNRWSRWSGKKLDPSTPAPTPPPFLQGVGALTKTPGRSLPRWQAGELNHLIKNSKEKKSSPDYVINRCPMLARTPSRIEHHQQRHV